MIWQFQIYMANNRLEVVEFSNLSLHRNNNYIILKVGDGYSGKRR